MMKKTVAILLCLAMLLGCAAAMAEAADKTVIGQVNMNGQFTLKCALPEGYVLVANEIEPNSYSGVVSSDDPERPEMILTIAFNEMYSNVERLNDLSDADMELLKETFTDEYQVEFSFMETAYGTKVLVAKEIEGEVDFVDFYTVYKGYEVEIVMVNEVGDTYVPVTDEQMQLAMDFLTNMDFVPAE